MKEMQLKPVYIQTAIIVAGIVFVLLAAAKPISDFGNYYYGSRFFAEGRNPSKEIYDIMEFNKNVEQAGEASFFLNHNTVTPQSMVIYLPFAMISNAALSKVIFNLFGLLLFAWTLGRFLKKFQPRVDWKFACAAFAALIPVYYNIVFGQTYLLLAALIMESVLQSEKRPVMAALLLSTAIALKVSPVIFLIWFLAERKWKVVAWTAGFFLLLVVPMYVIMPGVIHDFYFGALPRMGMGFVTDPYTSSFQGFVVFLRKLMVPDAVLHPETLLNGNERLVHFIDVIFFLVMSVLVIGAWKSKTEITKKFLVLILLLNITSGYTSTYSLLLILPFLSFGNAQSDWIKVMLYAALFVFPPRLFDGHTPFLEEYKLWIFILLFVMEIKPDWGFARLEKAQLIAGCVLLSIVILKFAQRPEVMPLTYYHPEKVKQDFILSAAVQDSSVVYVSSIPEGFAQFQLNTNGEIPWIAQTPADFYVRGVHLRMIAFRGDEALVLSDYHRGPGLFHLYTIGRHNFEKLMY